MEGSERGPGWPAAVSPLLTPALMVYYLCCWPGDAKSETSSGNKGRSVARHGAAGAASGVRRASDLFHRKIATSVVSLHLPSTSGHKKEALSAHRSHEEIRRHARGGQGASGGGGPEGGTSRYHSAPSVIDERQPLMSPGRVQVLHRRDWERSTRDLHIPLRSPDGSATGSCRSEQSPGSAPRAEPECSSLEDQQTDEQIVRPCKKHYTNIKSSKRKEKEIEDKERDATELAELTTFYIGDNERSARARAGSCAGAARAPAPPPPRAAKLFQAKEAKQSFNESIRRWERPAAAAGTLAARGEDDRDRPRFGFTLDDVIDRLDSLDRSGATHRSMESRVSLSRPPLPPPSVEAVGYEGGACYLPRAGAAARDAGVSLAAVTSRARHASDGDILAPAHACRPESGAFSESDLDLEVEVEVLEEVDPAPEEVPPPYEELQHFASPKKKETAI